MMTSSNKNIKAPRYWLSVRGIHRWPVNSSHKGQRCGAWMFSLICAWTNAWLNNRSAGELRHHRAHYDGTVMLTVGHWLITQVMTLSNWNIFCVTGHLYGEFNGPRWNLRTKASDAEFWFFYLRLNKRLSKQWWGWWFGTLSRPLCCHCNVL